MDRVHFIRAILLNFASALIIAGVACYFLATFNLNEVLYIGNLFGLYFLTVYGMEILIDGREIDNNAQRFIYLLIFIIIFDILFMVIMPLIFGHAGFNAADALTFVFNGAQFDFILSTLFYLSVFAILMIIFNIILYRQELGLMGE
ncbi:MAG: hypothetical protein IKE95_06335 [Methanobrevibacter sp.]|uniref:hypothetical protein n=1 Tax=Methanobrevibacter sp. TaxID=66852 RepID=UPI003867BEE0|nr:hypothetical protein [Methanobrevibacter sp.]